MLSKERMYWFRWLSYAAILFMVTLSCKKSLPTLDNVDVEAWKDDKLGCSGQRTAMSFAIESQSEKLLALSEQEIISLLGKPDENELYKRNQKFYYYFLEPSRVCPGSHADKEATRLVIRFNAVGLAKDVSIE
jgi:hypothetical protein